MHIERLRETIVSLETIRNDLTNQSAVEYCDKIINILNQDLSKIESNSCIHVHCPNCGFEMLIPKLTCTRCPVCFTKIGNCDE